MVSFTAVLTSAALLLTGCVSKPSPPPPPALGAPTREDTPGDKPALPAEPAVKLITPTVEKDGVMYGARPAGRGLVYIRANRSTTVPASELYYYDLASRKERLLAKSTFADGRVDTPSADWPWVVWLDWAASGSWRLFALNLEDSAAHIRTAAEYKHTGAAPGDEVYPSLPSVNGNRLVWTQRDDKKQYDVYIADLGPMKVERLTTQGDAGRPEVAGDRVVFTRNGYLWSLDLASRAEKQVSQMQVGYFSFGGGDHAAFTDVEQTPNGARHTLYQVNLTTGDLKQIAPQTEPGHGYFVAAGSKHVVWQLTGESSEATKLHVVSFAQPGQKLTLVSPSVENVGTVRHPYMLREQVAWLGALGPDRSAAFTTDLAELIQQR